jgi:hypothetical protein
MTAHVSLYTCPSLSSSDPFAFQYRALFGIRDIRKESDNEIRIVYATGKDGSSFIRSDSVSNLLMSTGTLGSGPLATLSLVFRRDSTTLAGAEVRARKCALQVARSETFPSFPQLLSAPADMNTDIAQLVAGAVAANDVPGLLSGVRARLMTAA